MVVALVGAVPLPRAVVVAKFAQLEKHAAIHVFQGAIIVLNLLAVLVMDKTD